MPFLITILATAAVAAAAQPVRVGETAIAVPPPRITATIGGEEVEMRIVTLTVRGGTLHMQYDRPVGIKTDSNGTE